MNLPTAGLWLAQIEVPYDQLLQAQLGTLALILAIVLVITIGTAVVLVVKLLNRMTDNVQESQKLSASVQLSINASRAEVSASQAAFTHAVTMNTDEMKRQTAVLLSIKTDFKAQLDSVVAAGVAEVKARLDAHDVVAQDGLKALKESISELRAEVQNGHRMQRDEVSARLDRMEGKADEILVLLKPPPNPPPPVAVSAFTVVERPAEPQEKAA